MLRNRVVELTQEPDGTWNVVTEQGTVQAEHVVNCGGLWAREIGRMVGVELPVLAMEHMYLLTEPMPEVEEFNKSTGREMIGVLDFKGEIYTRQERNGILLGTYEKACKPWSPVNTPWDFGHELLPPDLDRIAPSLEIGFRISRRIEKAGIKQIINGPFTFAPDGNPLVGPVQGLTNFWCACAVMAGFSQGGGVGLALSNWMVHGDPGFDVWGMDVARFGEWAGLRYTNAKVRENYSRRFSIRFPNEELPAARPAQTTPLYDTMLANERRHGRQLGPGDAALVRAEGQASRKRHRLLPPLQRFRSDRRGSARHARARRRHRDRQLRQIRSVGTGRGGFPQPADDQPHAEDRPHRADADAQRVRQADRRLHHRQGRRRPLHDLGLVRRAEIPYALVRKAPAEGRLGAHPPLRPDAGRPVDRRPEVARPAAEAGRCTTSRPRPSASWISARWPSAARPALVNRITYTGDLGYEIWMAPAYQRLVYKAIKDAGEEFGLVDFGMRALLSMRLEKNFPTWFRELRPIYGPFEGSMDRFIKLEKNDFIGREAAAKEQAEGPKLRRVSFIVDADRRRRDGRRADLGQGRARTTARWKSRMATARRASTPARKSSVQGCRRRSAVRGIVDGDWRVVGWVTSGGYGHYVGLDGAGLCAGSPRRGRGRGPVRDRDPRPPPPGAHQCRAALRPGRGADARVIRAFSA